jgi:hypothetical protein
MELYQESRPCPSCGTRLTLAGERDPAGDRVTRQEVHCPVCGNGVAFTARGVLGPGKVSLICYERPLRSEGRGVR